MTTRIVIASSARTPMTRAHKGELKDTRPDTMAAHVIKAAVDRVPGLKMEDIEKLCNVFFDEIAQRLASGGRVELRGFGAFSTRERDARTGRNPRTGEAVMVPGKRVPYFKPGKEMRGRLNTD